MKLDLRSRLRTIKSCLSQRRYLILFIAITVIYFSVNFILNQAYFSFAGLLHLRLSFILPYFSLNVLLGLLASLNITMVIYKFRQVRASNSEVGATTVSAFGGMLGGACPGCFAGVFPTLAGVFGVNMTLTALPFMGYEILIPVLAIVLVTLYIVANPLTCKIEIEK